MSKNINGAMLKAFYADDSVWPEDSYQDETVFVVNKETVTELPELKDSDVVVIKQGWFYPADPDQEPYKLSTHYNRWLKKQHSVVLSIEIPADQEQKVRETLRAMGATIK